MALNDTLLLSCGDIAGSTVGTRLSGFYSLQNRPSKFLQSVRTDVCFSTEKLLDFSWPKGPAGKLHVRQGLVNRSKDMRWEKKTQKSHSIVNLLNHIQILNWLDVEVAVQRKKRRKR